MAADSHPAGILANVNDRLHGSMSAGVNFDASYLKITGLTESGPKNRQSFTNLVACSTSSAMRPFEYKDGAQLESILPPCESGQKHCMARRSASVVFAAARTLRKSNIGMTTLALYI